ncbi:MAG: HMA2 domain-containing protein [Halodesulfovibrio sp.]|uniref:HMA2 domain-containing protein n=1 Tax=Halodesulfovibrio sp. TaxID=1912772 RepID=UPI00359EF954
MSTTTKHHARFRFRCESLKLEERANAVKDALSKTKGVAEVAVNKRVGSLLVLFDQGKVQAEQLFSTIARCVGLNPEQVRNKLTSFNRTITGRKGRRVVKRGMMAVGITALALLTVSEDKHAIAGVVWLSLIATHIYQNKRTLFN